MSDVKRWDLDADAETAPRFVVAASDYDALTAECAIEVEALRKRLDEAERALRVFHAMIDPFNATPEEHQLWQDWQTRFADSAATGKIDGHG